MKRLDSSNLCFLCKSIAKTTEGEGVFVTVSAGMIMDSHNFEGKSTSIQIPDDEKYELFLTAAKVAAGLLPFAGGSAAELLGYLGQKHIARRQRTFFVSVINGLEDMQVQLDQLNESFWTTLLQAAEVALRTHQKEKLDALKNAVLNVAKPSAPDDDLQSLFINMVADLTLLHMRLLKFILHPECFDVDRANFDELHVLNPQKTTRMWEVLESHVVGRTRRDLIQMCLNDLISRGLLEYRNDPGPLQGLILPWPANIAWDFYGFISSDGER